MPVVPKEAGPLGELVFGTGGAFETGTLERVWGSLNLCCLFVFVLGLSFLSLFTLHQVTLWISLDPEDAFHRAKLGIYVYMAAWDTSTHLYNAFTEVRLVAVPGWNSQDHLSNAAFFSGFCCTLQTKHPPRPSHPHPSHFSPNNILLRLQNHCLCPTLDSTQTPS